MSIIDYMDSLEARRAIRLAVSHGNSDSITAFRDRLDAQKAVMGARDFQPGDSEEYAIWKQAQEAKNRDR
jgi:hypothetical protein